VLSGTAGAPAPQRGRQRFAGAGLSAGLIAGLRVRVTRPAATAVDRYLKRLECRQALGFADLAAGDRPDRTAVDEVAE
jgi:hypothetical protein